VGTPPGAPHDIFYAGITSVKALPKIQFAIFSDRFAIFGDLNGQKRELKKTTFPRFAIFGDSLY
jgi:hypothetical protein